MTPQVLDDILDLTPVTFEANERTDIVKRSVFY